MHFEYTFPLVAEITSSIVVAIALMSFIEYYLHGYLMHQRFLPEFVYRIIPALDSLYRAHAIDHHTRYAQMFVQDERPHERESNIEIKLVHPIIGTLVVFPFAVLCWIYVSPYPPIVLVAVFFIHRLIWNKIHREMHHPKHPSWSHHALYKFLARYHFIHHHGRPSKNINVVLPFADYVIGRHAIATTEELERMREMRFLP